MGIDAGARICLIYINETEQIIAQRQKLLGRLPVTGEMVRGSVVERTIRNHASGCARCVSGWPRRSRIWHSRWRDCGWSAQPPSHAHLAGHRETAEQLLALRDDLSCLIYINETDSRARVNTI